MISKGNREKAIQLSLKKCKGWGVQPCEVENPHVPLQSALSNHESCNTEAHIYWKKKSAYINGPMQFKAMLFKDQLHNIIFKSTNSGIRMSG